MKRVAFVFQNTRLFKDTLLNNIKAARPDATREEVMKTASEAQCKDIIDTQRSTVMDLKRSLEQEVLISQEAKTRGLRWQGQS